MVMLARRPDLVRATRLALFGATLIQFAVIADPRNSLFDAYPHAYAQWVRHGDETAWAWRMLATVLFGGAALFRWGVATDLVRMLAALCQGAILFAMGLMFAATEPPQTGAAYLAFAGLALRLSYISWFRGL